MVTFAGLSEADERSYKPPARLIQAPVAQVTEASLARARRHKLIVQAWTVNDRATMDLLLAQGVDGIISDAPATLESAILAAP